MRKTNFVKKMKSVLRPIYFGLGIFAVTGLAFYVFAATVTFPATQPSPVTGVVGMFVGLTSATTETFNAPSSYSTVNGWCNGRYPGSHVCASMELINSYNHDSQAIRAITSGFGLINSGAPGFTSFTNDCSGWSTIQEGASQGVIGSYYVDNRNFATRWQFNGNNGSGSVALCSALGTTPFACCM